MSRDPPTAPLGTAVRWDSPSVTSLDETVELQRIEIHSPHTFLPRALHARRWGRQKGLRQGNQQNPRPLPEVLGAIPKPAPRL